MVSRARRPRQFRIYRNAPPAKNAKAFLIGGSLDGSFLPRRLIQKEKMRSPGQIVPEDRFLLCRSGFEEIFG